MTQPYDDPIEESLFRMGPSGGQQFLVSTIAHVSTQLKSGFDRQNKAGRSFGKVKFLGTLPATFNLTFIVLPEDEFQFYNEVVPLFRAKGRKGVAPPMDVSNLQINRLGIFTVFVLATEIGEPNSLSGRAVSVEIEEWTPGPSKPRDDNQGKLARDPEALQPAVGAALARGGPRDARALHTQQSPATGALIARM